jgi:hypothetical protein
VTVSGTVLDYLNFRKIKEGKMTKKSTQNNIKF